MSVTTFILGESGTGKTASMRNLKPEDTALIQVVRKPLPFKPQGWAVSAEQDEGGALKATGNPGFNTQPPEGGWYRQAAPAASHNGFNTQPPEGGWHGNGGSIQIPALCFNTQPPEGGWCIFCFGYFRVVLFQHTAA